MCQFVYTETTIARGFFKSKRYLTHGQLFSSATLYELIYMCFLFYVCYNRWLICWFFLSVSEELEKPIRPKKTASVEQCFPPNAKAAEARYQIQAIRYNQLTRTHQVRAWPFYGVQFPPQTSEKIIVAMPFATTTTEHSLFLKKQGRVIGTGVCY